MRRPLVLSILLGAAGLAAWLFMAPAQHNSAPEAASPPAAEPAPPVASGRAPARPAPTPDLAVIPSTPAPAPAPASRGRGPAAVRAALESALVDGLDRTPSPAELDAMTDAALRMRDAQDALRKLEGGSEEGGERKRLTDRVAQAGADFETHAGLPLSELTSRVGGGLTAPDEDTVELIPLEPAEEGPR